MAIFLVNSVPSVSPVLRCLTAVSTRRVASTLAHHRFQPQTSTVGTPPLPLPSSSTTVPPPPSTNSTSVKPYLEKKSLQQQQQPHRLPSEARSWTVVRYHATDLKQALSLVETPITTSTAVRQPEQVLVRVLASSVSLLDLAQTRSLDESVRFLSSGTGSAGSSGNGSFSDSCRRQRLPLTPGRDFVGAIVARGAAVSQFKPGDLVWGTVAPGECGGAHADYVVTEESAVAHKPANLSHVEAASLPFVGLAAWSAISTFGELTAQNAYKKKVLILGGSSGVGAFAIQLLRYWGAEVTATCSGGVASAQWLQALTGLTEVVDHQDTERFLANYSAGPFDFILDASSSSRDARRHYALLAHHSVRSDHRVLHPGTMYVTMRSPLLGCETGSGEHGTYSRSDASTTTTTTVADAINDTLSGRGGGGGALMQNSLRFRWAYYLPNPKALLHIGDLVERGAIRPLTSAVYEFDRALEAYQAVATAGASADFPGKVVLSNQ